MLCRSLLTTIVSGLLLFSMNCYSDVGVYNKGMVKLRGNIIEGGCLISIGDRESSELIVDMGAYRNDQFKHVGDYADREYVTFRIDVSLCNIDAGRNIDLLFSGDTASEDKSLFKVRPDKSFNNKASESDDDASTGLGLALFDENQNRLYPNVINSNTRMRGESGTLIFLAKYQMVRNQTVAGRYLSEVNFKIFYP
ncbi:fimbrial protein [Pantoea vagans]|uniref:fimbrial protein n=1 Tax=Pantoea vagans TaxID=470934 RepID=UPI003FA362D9